MSASVRGITLLLFILASAAFSGTPALAVEPLANERWSVERANDWYAQQPWHHDLLREDGKAYRPAEVALIGDIIEERNDR